MSFEEILVRDLYVTHQAPAGGNVVAYLPRSVLPDQDPSDPVLKNFDLRQLEQRLDRFEATVRELLLRAAVFPAKRDHVDISPIANEIAQMILPETGFGSILDQDVHPRFYWNIDGVLSRVPWEALRDRYMKCEACEGRAKFHPTTSNFCSAHGTQLKKIEMRFGTDYHVAHQVRRGDISTSAGKVFAIVADPNGDLCRATQEHDPQTPDQAGIASGNHINEIVKLLDGAGYEVRLYRGKTATPDLVRTLLKDASLAGFYFFGHGIRPQSGDDAYLQLHGGDLFVSDIEEIAPRVPFVFLNACEGTLGGTDVRAPKQSIAEAFAKATRDVDVIAATSVIVNYQAAAAAVEFFRAAAKKKSIGHALKKARQASRERHDAGQPDIGWFAYRLIGDPNSTLPPPRVPEPGGDNGSKIEIFQGNVLNQSALPSSMPEVLLRAGKRMYLQDRGQATQLDILAGLLRRGEFTRTVLFECGIQPDAVYEAFSQPKEPKDQDHENA